MTSGNSSSQQQYVYNGYQGKDNPTEHDRIVHLLDIYSTTEGFVAQYIPKWIEVSPNETVKGGLLTIQAREAAHARLMKKRLLELGETSKAKIPEERREMEMSFFSSPHHTDEEKLKMLVSLFGDIEKFLKPVTDLINQITDDLHTKELLRTILDDERESVNWIQETHQTLSP